MLVWHVLLLPLVFGTGARFRPRSSLCA